MFTIQLGHPKIKNIPAQEFETISEVFLHLFRLKEESFYFFWNEIPLRFRYREDLYANFNDMLALVWILQKEKKGATKVRFQNQLLTMHLTCNWDHDELHIQGDFKAFEYLYEPYERALSELKSMVLSKTAFLNEWKTLLRQIVISLEASKCTIKDGVERRRLELLQRTEKLIESYGELYSR